MMNRLLEAWYGSCQRTAAERLRTLAAMLLACALVVLACPHVAWGADELTSGDWRYTLDDGGNATITSYGGSQARLAVPGTIDGHTVTSVTFENSARKDMEAIELPNTVTKLPANAFSGVQASEIYLDDALTALPERCFANCVNLRAITVPNRATTVGTHAFSNCTSLAKVTFQEPSKVSIIGNYAFENCTALRTIELPESLTSLGKHVFHSCQSLEEIVVNSKPWMDSEVFYGCTSLCSFMCCLKDPDVTPAEFDNYGLPAQTTCMSFSIDSNGYLILKRVYTKQESVSIPSKLGSRYITAINQWVFADGVTDKHVTIVTFPDDDYRIKTIYGNAFRDMGKLTSITLPPSVELMYGHAFDNCSSLTSADLSQTKIVELSPATFAHCAKLTDVELPPNLETVGSEAFAECRSLSTIMLPASVTSIGSSAFACSQIGPNVAKLTIGMPDSNESMAIADDFAKYRTLEPVDKIEILVTVGSWSDVQWNYAGVRKLKDNKKYLPVPLDDPNVVLKVESDESNPYTYTTKAIRPEVTGKRWYHTITADDYTYRAGSNNVNAGSASINIGGRNTTFAADPLVSVPFTIQEMSLDKVGEMPLASHNWDGDEWRPEVDLYFSIGTPENPQYHHLREGTDYTLSYDNNIDAGEDTAIVKVSAVKPGNYTGEKTLSFTINKRRLSEVVIADIPDQLYTGSPLKPTPQVQLADRDKGLFPLQVSLGDIAWDYRDNTNVGEATAVLSAPEGSNLYGDPIEVTFNIVKRDVNDVTLEAVPDQTYAGTPLEPDVVLRVNDSQVLKRGVDYALSYQNNVNAGENTATVTITGIGGCTGTRTTTFSIKPKAVTVRPNDDSKDYSQSDPPFGAIVTGTVGSDTVSYAGPVREAGENVGAYALTCTGEADQGNYTVTFEPGTFTVKPMSIRDASVPLFMPETYDGAEHTPGTSVRVGNRTLEAGTDYDITYDNNLDTGTAQVTITGKGNYTGTLQRSFAINARNIAHATISVGLKQYTGLPLEPHPDLVVLKGEGRDGADLTLAEGTDYEVRGYENNTGPGTATITIAGKGNYQGTASGTFEIASSLYLGDADVAGIPTQQYTGTDIEPELQVSLGTLQLVRDVDYTAEFSNNRNVGEAQVTLTGKGDVYGTIATAFVIEPKPATVTADAKTKAYGDDDPELTATVEGTVGDDTLVYQLMRDEGEAVGEHAIRATGEAEQGNYTVSFVDGVLTIGYASLDDVQIADIDAVVYDGAQHKLEPTITYKDKELVKGRDYTLSWDENTNVGTGKVRVKGAGGFRGTREVSFDIAPADIAEAEVQAEARTYDGTEQKPAPTVTWNERMLEEGADYEIAGYADNTAAGTAALSVTGKGNFAGTARGTFQIATRPVTITVDNASKIQGTADPAFTGTVEGLVAEGDLGEVSYVRTNDDEEPGTYRDVLSATYAENPNYDVSVVKGDFVIVADYTVRFDANVPANASTTCSGSMDDQGFAADEKKALSANGYTLPGYDFAGWNTEADGTGTTYADKEEVEGLSGSGGTVTLYAQWRAKAYKVVFNPGEIGGDEHRQTAYFDQPGKLAAYSDAAFGWSSGGKTLHGWAGAGFGSFYGDGASFVNLCGEPREDGSLADKELVAQWIGGGDIVVTITKDGVPQDGLEDELSLVDGSGTEFSVPMSYERGQYIFDPSQASSPGVGQAQLPPGEYDIRFDAPGYPTATEHITYGSDSASSAVFAYHTVTYEVENGTWADGTAGALTEVVLSGASPASVPEGMIASEGFTGGMWDVEPRGATISAASTFTYAFDAEQEVYGLVEWDDNDNELGGRPDKVTVRLMANDAESSAMEVAEGANGLWAFSFDHLAPRDSQGNEIAYSVAADDVPEYTVEVVHDDGNAYRITYTRPTPVKPTLTITAKDQKYTYNGQTQGEGDTAYEDPAEIAEKVTVEGLLEGDELTSVVLDGQGQEVGERPIEVTGFSINNNPGARDKYDVVLVPGKLTIDPAEATIAVNSASKVAGEADPVFTGTVEGLVHESDLGEVRYVRTNDDEAPGTYAGVLDAEYTANPNYDVSVAKGDFTIRAVYTLRWLDGDESILQEKTYVEGEPAPVYDGRDPSKAATAQYTYAFTSWDGGTVEGAVTTYRPLFSETVNEYTVRFENDDGTELQAGKVAYGETPEYTGATPEKPATSQHTYAFKGWSPEVVPVMGDATYTATYDEIPVVATLTFDPAGGTIGGRVGPIAIEANVGDVIAIPKAPVRVGYEFRYWRGSEYHPGDEYTVEGDHTFTAVWEREVEPVTETFTVTFDANGHGVAPATQEVESGKAAMRPADPTADGWAFGGWYTDKGCTQAYDFSKPVSSDMTLYAKWTKKASPTPSPDKPEPADPVSPRPSIPQTGDPFAGMLACVTGLAFASGFCLVLAGVGLRRRIGTHRR